MLLSCLLSFLEPVARSKKEQERERKKSALPYGPSFSYPRDQKAVADPPATAYQAFDTRYCGETVN
jgi:hexokinase